MHLCNYSCRPIRLQRCQLLVVQRNYCVDVKIVHMDRCHVENWLPYFLDPRSNYDMSCPVAIWLPGPNMTGREQCLRQKRTLQFSGFTVKMKESNLWWTLRITPEVGEHHTLLHTLRWWSHRFCSDVLCLATDITLLLLQCSHSWFSLAIRTLTALHAFATLALHFVRATTLQHNIAALLYFRSNWIPISECGWMICHIWRELLMVK